MAFPFGSIYTKFSCIYRPCIRSISFFKNKRKKEEPYVIVRPTADEYCDILQLMWNSYHPYEPTAKSVNLGYRYNKVFDETALRILSQGYSYVAKCKYTGCIIGGSLNESTCEWDAAQTDKLACTIKCKATRQLYHFWAHIQRMPNLYDKYCAPNVFEISTVFVSRDERNRGLATKLMKQSKILGADAGFRVIRVDATNIYTAKICQKLNMQLLQTVPYCTYLNEKNEPIFRPEPPNTEVRIYIDLPHAMPRN